MKRSIRVGVFETNSSSVHSITICSKEEYEQWENGELLLNRYGSPKFINKNEKIEELKNDPECNDINFDNEDEINEVLREEDLYTYSDYDDIEYEQFYKTFITKNGEEIVAFGYYGFDR